MNQIGQTGATPRQPRACLPAATARAAVVGWRFIGDRRAISLDLNCGWMRGKADVVYIADAFQVMAKVNELSDERGRKSSKFHWSQNRDQGHPEPFA